MIKYQVTAISQCVTIFQGLPGSGEIAITFQTESGEKVHLRMPEQVAAWLKESLDGHNLPPSGMSPVKDLQ